MAGATWLWRESGQEIEQFETSTLPADTTYELFLVNARLRRTEASLQLASLPDASQAELDAAAQDREIAILAIADAETVLVPLLESMITENEDFAGDNAPLALMSGSIELARTLLEGQVVGEPVDTQFEFLVSFARDAVGGTVLPLTDSGNQQTTGVYQVMATTIHYLDQLDRDRAQVLGEVLGSREVPELDAIDASRLLRESLWRDVTSSRNFLTSVSRIGWFGTASNPTSPLLLDATDPFGVAIEELTPIENAGDRQALFLRLMEIDKALEADVSLGYAELQRAHVAHRAELIRTRALTALVSAVMSGLGVALAVLTYIEVRRRRNVEAAHADALLKLEEKADRDPTTGVWNRRRLESVVPNMIAGASEAGESVVLAYLDLDHFKAINDVWGHRTGDEVLQTVTDRLTGFTYRNVPFELSRIGGDEFIVFASVPAPSKTWLEGLGKAVLVAVDSKMEVSGRVHELTASVGIATSTADSTLDSLLLEADSSLILAKQDRGIAVVYDRKISRTGELVHALPSAIASGEIRAHLQPVVDIATGQIIHVEALARWERPDGVRVSPAEFIPLVESYGLAEDLTIAILRSVSDVLESSSTPSRARVWINVSPRELDVANFAQRFVMSLRELEISPSRIGIEIIETAAVRDPARLAIELRRLREVGVSVAIDDFGSGYSPLGYLRNLPVDIVKLDRSLVADIDADQANQHLVLGIVGLAHELGMEIVAEGVERIEERDWLATHDVARAQGYLFGRPVCPSELEWTPDVGRRHQVSLAP